MGKRKIVTELISVKREKRPLSAGAAFDRIRLVIEDTLQEAEEAKEATLEKIPKRVRAITARVTSPRERELLEVMTKDVAYCPSFIFDDPPAADAELEEAPESVAVKA